MDSKKTSQQTRLDRQFSNLGINDLSIGCCLPPGQKKNIWVKEHRYQGFIEFFKKMAFNHL